MVAAIVFASATTNVIGQMFAGIYVDITHKGFVTIITVRAMVTG
jgi:hypothetical protein